MLAAKSLPQRSIFVHAVENARHTGLCDVVKGL